VGEVGCWEGFALDSFWGGGGGGSQQATINPLGGHGGEGKKKSLS